MAAYSEERLMRFGDVARNIKVIVDPQASGLERYIAGEHMDTDDLKLRRWGTVGDGYLGPAFHMKFAEGQILYGSRRTYLRKVAVADFDGICANTTFVIEAIPEKIYPPLLPFIMQTEPFTQHAIVKSRGSTNPYVVWSDIACYEFPLPPLDEQRRIAEILWAVDEMSESYSTVIKEIKRLKVSYWNDHIKETNWGSVCIGDIGSVSNGTTPSRKESKYWDNGTIAWLPTGKVHERIITSADEFVTETALKETSLHLLPVGSILVAMIGQGKTRGSAAYLAIEACINQNFAAIQPSTRVDSWYLFHALSNSYQGLRSFSHGSNQGALNCRLVEEFRVPLPPIDEQIQIVTAMRACDREISDITLHLERVAKMKKSLFEQLLGIEPSHV